MNPIWSNFTGFPDQSTLNQNFDNTRIGSSDEQRATYERVAGACAKEWYKPIFDTQPKTVEEAPDGSVTIVAAGVEVVPVDLKEENPSVAKDAPKDTSSQTLTIPPMKIEQNTLLNAVLIGLGVVFVLKIID